MGKHMKKLLLLMLSFFVALGVGLANASSRSDAMSADINVVEDYDLIFTFPNKVIDYKNIVDLRLNSLSTGSSDDWGGILDGKFESIGVIGVYVHRSNDDLTNGYSWSDVNYQNDALYAVYQNQSTHGFATAVRHNMKTPNPLFDLFWGKTFSNLNVGVKVNYADSRDNYTGKYSDNVPEDTSTYTDKNYSRAFGIQAGVGMKDLGPFQEANFAAGYSVGTWNDSAVDTYTNGYVGDNYEYKSDGIHAINLNANLRHDIDEANDLKLFANAKFANFGVKGTDWRYSLIADQYAAKTKGTVLNAGFGVNHKVNEGVGLVSAGLKFNLQKYTNTASASHDGVDVNASMVANNDLLKQEFTVMDVPLFMSVEAKVKSWLTLRAGASYYLYTKVITKDTYGMGSTDEYYSSNSTYSDYSGNMETMLNTGSINFNTGFGLNWKNWVLDCVLDTDVMENNVGSFQPGRGIFFSGNTVTVLYADLKYKF
jgi:hypothetical protein